MGIDRIGKSGAPAPLPEVGGASPSGPAGPAFHVHAPSSSVGTPAVGGPSVEGASPAGPAAVPLDAAVRPVGALDRLRSGEVDLDGYVNLKVDEATAHLSALPSAQLDAIRSALRERISSDPALVDLVRAATGQVPTGQVPDGQVSQEGDD
jgi:hypothetical protein